MSEVYFPFGEREISWLKSRDPQLKAVLSKADDETFIKEITKEVSYGQ